MQESKSINSFNLTDPLLDHLLCAMEKPNDEISVHNSELDRTSDHNKESKSINSFNLTDPLLDHLLCAMEKPTDEISVHNAELDISFFGMAITALLKTLSEGKTPALHEQLEDNVKGTPAEGTTKTLFEGRYQKSSNLNSVTSVCEEPFLSLKLDVKNCKDVYSSFDKFLKGGNIYQGSKRGVSFREFPPILQLQLARFQLDKSQGTMVKVNSRYEYPLNLDLDRENGKYMSNDADRTIRNLYTLSSVIVHSGGVQDGKYFAIIRPTLKNEWLKLEDGLVTRVDARRALDEQYGGDIQLRPFKFEKGKNAFMLIYIRESEKDSIMGRIGQKDVTEHAKLKTGEGKDDNGIGEDAAANRFVIIKVERDGDLPCSFRVDKQVSFRKFTDVVAEYFGMENYCHLGLYKPEDPSSLLMAKNLSDTVESIVGAGDKVTLFLRINSYKLDPKIFDW